MNISTRVNYKRLSHKGEFREKLFTDCHTLLVGVKEFLLYFQCYLIHQKLGV
jgi:hypothetical protein